MFNLQKFIYTSPYAFFGLANIRLSSSGAASFSSSITNDFYLKIESLVPFKEFYISYIIVGVNPSSVCSGCSDTLINGDNCVVICPNNTYVVSYKDGGKGCRSCPDSFNLVVNQNKNGCSCKDEFIEKNGFCIASALANGATASIIKK